MKTKEEIRNYLKDLREEIIQAFESLEPVHRFEREAWRYDKGEGGGEIAQLRGDVFEKAAVNLSEVGGETFPGSDGKGPFYATGVSLITHMSNPHAPTVHMNVRYIETPERSWIGGGYDITPMGVVYEEDIAHFHQVALNALGEKLYAEFSKNAKEYFYIPHRKKERGRGGIFFDHQPLDFPMWGRVGSTFLDAVMPIYRRRIVADYTLEEKEKQYELRGHYAEFNLAYDRGTKFGFTSGGNPKAILCSMPPLAKW